jgi:hypothetical protein
MLLLIICGGDAEAERKCLTSIFGERVCPKFNYGGIDRDLFNTIVCGPGECMKTIYKDIVCSSIPGGAIGFKPPYNDIICEGGCVKASPYYCMVVR